MNIIPTNYTIAQLRDKFEGKTLTINRDYQRSDEIWPVFARSALVETALLGYPMPKITIRQSTDLKSLKTFEEIVDGQQRTRTLVDFLDGKFELSNSINTDEFRGQSIHTLESANAEKFVTYAIGVDLLVGATNEEVIEAFRRMNSYTAPLNPEEQRHATYQGNFKWFIYDMQRIYEKPLSDMTVFKQKSFIRMQDAKLLTEVCHAALNGISTTSRKSLDSLYIKYNTAFAGEEELKAVLSDAIATLSLYDAIPSSPLAKPYNFYSLLLAMIHVRHPQDALNSDLEHATGQLVADDKVDQNLSRLADALEDADNPPAGLEGFVAAASEKTNVKAQRQTRFNWFYRALTNQ